MTTIDEGVPHERIVAYVDEHDVEVVVMGAKGRSAFKRSLLGSATEGVLRRTDTPVLVVGEEDAEPE